MPALEYVTRSVSPRRPYRPRWPAAFLGAQLLLAAGCAPEARPPNVGAGEQAITGAGAHPFAANPVDNAVLTLGVAGLGCSGVLVDPTVVATAGHCLENLFDTPGFPQLSPRRWQTYSNNFAAITVTLRGTSTLPALTLQTRTLNFPGTDDAVLLRLPSPVPPEQAVPRAMLFDDPGVRNGETLFGAGYGPTLSNPNWTQMFYEAETSPTLAPNYLCWGYPDSSTTHQSGDSGSPVFWHNLTGPVVGIYQGGATCTNPAYPNGGVQVFGSGSSTRIDLGAFFAQNTYASPPPPSTVWYRLGPISTATNLARCAHYVNADLNGDAIDDLVCTYDYGSASTRTLAQLSGSGTLTGWRGVSALSPSGTFDINRCVDVFAGDVDGDGSTDLVCPYNYGGSSTRTFVQLNDGHGSLGPWTAFSSYHAGTFDPARCKALALQDFDRDGDPDLICAYDYGTSTRTFVQINAGSTFGTWTSESGLSYYDLDQCARIHVADVTGDARPDLVCAYNYGSGNTRTLVQPSLSTGFDLWQAGYGTYQTGFDLGACRTVALFDATGDGIRDLVCPYQYGDDETTTFVQEASRLGQFSAWKPYGPHHQPFFDLGRCRDIVLSDVDGDGMTDMLCPERYSSGVARTWVQYNFAPGAGFARWSIHAPSSATDLARCTHFAAIDVDGDGTRNLLCVYDSGASSTWTLSQD